MTTPPSTLTEQALRLQQECRLRGHRRLLLLCGAPEVCRAQAHQMLRVLAAETPLWVGDLAEDGCESLRNPQARERLGGEHDLLVYDAFCGFDPDAFGALAGTLRGGGLLLLLTPPLDDWPRYPDPELARLAVEGYPPAAYDNGFLRRLAGMLQSDPTVAQVNAVAAPPESPPAANPTTAVTEPSGDCLTADQAQAVEAILQAALGHRRRPLVLTSDRGRGKSSALGIAAARLMSGSGRRILVTAPRRGAVDALFRQARMRLPSASVRNGDLLAGDSLLAYAAPDHLLAEPQAADLLLVDEAAAIPTALLEGLLEHYPRLVFATTVHGYEGTGRGFSLRFKAHLDRVRPQWRERRLDSPIRWAADDPLEPLLFRLLGLDCEPAPDARAAEATPDSCRPLLPGREDLLADEGMLRQLFGLLVLAHYRTTPLDLRLLLDAPNLQTLLLRHGDAVVGAALLSREGGFDPALAREIWAGRRRPKGHLLAQSLAAHVGIADAPCLNSLRIVRIAIHPAARRRGLGSRMMTEIREWARQQGMDYLGSSFGVSEDLFDFWLRNGLRPVRLGLRSGTRSGDHSVLMIEPLTPSGERMNTQAGERFARQLPALLGDPLRDLPPALATRLLCASTVAPCIELDAIDREDLAGFAFARREFESCLPAIERLALIGLGRAGAAQPDLELLVARVIQKRSWSECARLCGFSGRGEIEKRLRVVMGDLYRELVDPVV